MLSAGDRIVAGVSGGADSVCMLALLLAWRERRPLSLAVAHVNHGLRREAGEDAGYVEELCGREPLVAEGFATYKLKALQPANKENNYLL